MIDLSPFILVIHIFVAAALIGVVLLQRSEGGALGIGGGGGGGGGFMTGRGAANVLTRTTAILAAIFFVTSISLTVFNSSKSESESVIDIVPAGESQLDDSAPSEGLNSLELPPPPEAGSELPSLPEPPAPE